MPIIAPVDEAQKLVPGSPVPIGSSEGARMQGEAAASFGKSMAYLGDVLQEANKHAKASRDRSTEAIETTMVERKALELRASSADTATQEGVKAFNSQMDEYIGERAAGIKDPTVKAAFIANARGKAEDNAKLVYADQVKKNLEMAKIQHGELVSAMGSLTALDPRKIEDSFGNLELIIKDDPSYSAEERMQFLHDGKKNILKAALTGMADRKQFSLAKDVLAQHQAGVLSTDEIRAEVHNIDKMDWEYHSRLNLQQTQSEKRTEKDIKKAQDNAFARYSARLSTAGASETDRAAVFADINADLQVQALRPEQADHLMGSTRFEKAGTLIEGTRIMREAVESGNYRGAIDNIEALSNNGLNPKSAETMALQLHVLKSNAEKHPERPASVKEQRAKLEELTAAATADLPQPQREAMAKKVLDKYYGMVVNPSVKASRAAEMVFDQFFGGKVPPVQKAPDDIQKQRQEILDKHLADKRAGKPVDDNATMKRLQELDLQRRRMKNFSPNQNLDSVEGTGLKKGN